MTPATVRHQAPDGPRPRVVVIGGGMAGLSAAYRLTHRADTELILLERDTRLGGKIVTEHGDGFVIEGGPEALLTAKPAALALCQELGLGERLIGTNPEARGSFIMRARRLHPLPDGLSGLIPSRLWPIAATRLVSPLGKLRMALDLVLPRRSRDDESLAAFIERRLGREAYRWLVDPLVGGIYAADGHRLSLAATFPQLQALEREHGGLIRGALATKRRVAPPPAGASPSPFQAPRGGLGELVATLTDHLRDAGVRIETGAAATAITRAEEGYEVTLASGQTMPADAIVCAAPAPDAANLLASLDPELAAGLRAIPHASVATIALAYVDTAIPRPLAGSGYLTPRAEGRLVKAGTWVSRKWPDRAPEGASLIRVSLGGAGQADVLAMDDDALIAAAREEMRTVLGIEVAPIFTRIFRWPRAMPQYEPGHLPRIAEIEARLASHPGLALAGNAYRGVGLADCMQSGSLAAQRIDAFLDEPAVPPSAPERGDASRHPAPGQAVAPRSFRRLDESTAAPARPGALLATRSTLWDGIWRPHR